MSDVYKAVKITDRVYWVGAIDWGIRDFHGYLTAHGTTYNAFLVMGEKIALIDTVKGKFADEMLSRIRSVVPLEKIKYIVSNHAELDHSGALPKTIEAIKPEKVFASSLGVKNLKAHFHGIGDITAVKEGENLELGNATLTFMEARMVHWPDSMLTYLQEDGLLFAQDGFGMHLASVERFADQIDPSIVEYESAKYYANILTLYSQNIYRLLDKVHKIGLKIDMIAPDHGPIWRKDIGRILSWYGKWAQRRPSNKAVIVYDTMWESTAAMAHAIGEGLGEAGTSVKIMPLKSNHRSDVVTELLYAGALLVGSPTINNGMYPTVADFLTYVKGLKFANLVGQCFGSYGWSGESIRDVTEYLDALKVEKIGEPVKAQFVPDAQTLLKCRELGGLISNKLKEIKE